MEGKVKKAKEKGQNNDKQPVIYEFVSDQVNEEEGTASEVFNVKYASGKTEQTNVEMKKEEDGHWYLVNKK